MADYTYITIVLRKTVADVTEAKALLATVKTKLADKPDVQITGTVGVVINEEE